MTAIYEKTPTRRIKLTLTFPEDYPSHPCIIDIAAERNVPPGLKKKLEKELGGAAKENAGNHVQVEAVLSRLMSFVDSNRFVACWKELRQVVDKVQKLSQIESTRGSTVSINNVKGVIKLRLQCEKYYYSCRIVVNEAYPTTTTHADWGNPCKLTKDGTNFPPKIESMLTTQAKELVRKMQDGMTAENALKLSNPVRAPKGVLDEEIMKAPPKVRVTQEALKSLQRDTDTLAHVRDLRQVNTETIEGNAKIKAHTAKDRKEARRAINKITNNEISQDQAAETKEEQWQLEERARMAGYDLHDRGAPQPSLLSLVTFLETKIQRLPQETCPICKQPSLPADPTKLKALYSTNTSSLSDMEKKKRKLARKKRPLRTYCGCWYHYDCLDKFMREPPFGESCPVHCRRVYHPDWPAERKTLEREWAHREARKREVEDAVAAFMS